MNKDCEYVRQAYGVPACIGRGVTVNGRQGVIAKDMGAHIGINFDDDEPTAVYAYHPMSKGLEYGEMREVRKLTRSQKRYQEYLDVAECYESFASYLGIK